jgi:excisionase family DNA binding protein
MNIAEHAGDSRRCLSLDEVCREIGIGRTTLWRRVKSGELPVVRIGSRVLVQASDLEAFIERHKTTTPRGSAEASVHASAEMGSGDDSD